MAIRYEPTGYGATVQSKAAQAGAAEAATKTANMAFQIAEANKERQFKAQMENLNYEMQIEAQRRAQLFEIEKMETRSRIDFEEEEKKRIQRKQQLDLDMQSLDKAVKEGLLSDNPEDQVNVQKAKQELLLRNIDLPEAARQLFHIPTREEVMGIAAARDLLKPKTGTTPTAPVTAVQGTTSIPAPIQKSQIFTTETGQLRGITELGQNIPIEDTKLYRVQDPATGQFYDITGDEFKDPQKANYRFVNEAGVKPAVIETPSVKLSEEDKELTTPRKDYAKAFFGPYAPAISKFLKNLMEPKTGWGQQEIKYTQEQIDNFPISIEEKNILRQLVQKLIAQESDKPRYPGVSGKW
jgi:hypothetical protein